MLAAPAKIARIGPPQATHLNGFHLHLSKRINRDSCLFFLDICSKFLQIGEYNRIERKERTVYVPTRRLPPIVLASNHWHRPASGIIKELGDADCITNFASGRFLYLSPVDIVIAISAGPDEGSSLGEETGGTVAEIIRDLIITCTVLRYGHSVVLKWRASSFFYDDKALH